MTRWLTLILLLLPASLFGQGMGGSLLLYPPTATLPVPSVTGGTYTTAQSVTYSSTNTEASGTSQIYYTSDGTTPNLDSMLYTSAISVPASATTTLKAIAFNVPIYKSNVDDTLTGWKAVCIQPNCNPGGTGVPSATSQTINNTSPQLDGDSMQLSVTADANSTNVLWSYNAGACDTCLNQISDFNIYISSNGAAASAYEMDSYLFDKTHNRMNMWGLQCNQSGGYWQIANDVSPWTNTPVACSLSYGVWHHIQFLYHRFINDTNCGAYGCNYYDALIIDGTVHALNMTQAAEELPTGWGADTGLQFQIDIPTASSTSPVTITENVDEAKIQSAETSSAVNSTTYTIQ